MHTSSTIVLFTIFAVCLVQAAPLSDEELTKEYENTDEEDDVEGLKQKPRKY